MEPFYRSRPDAPTQTYIGASLGATCTKILYKDRMTLYNNLYNVQYSSMSKHKQMDFYLLVILDISWPSSWTNPTVRSHFWCYLVSHDTLYQMRPMKRINQIAITLIPLTPLKLQHPPLNLKFEMKSLLPRRQFVPSCDSWYLELLFGFIANSFSIQA